MPKQVDADILQMALVGYRAQLAQIDVKMAEIRKRLKVSQSDVPDNVRVQPRRQLSVAARRRIAAAQKARWAAYRAKSGTGAKKSAPKAKRTLSPAAKAKLAVNLAKARAARAKAAA
jgi:hypothetical protein